MPRHRPRATRCRRRCSARAAKCTRAHCERRHRAAMRSSAALVCANCAFFSASTRPLRSPTYPARMRLPLQRAVLEAAADLLPTFELADGAEVAEVTPGFWAPLGESDKLLWMPAADPAVGAPGPCAAASPSDAAAVSRRARRWSRLRGSPGIGNRSRPTLFSAETNLLGIAVRASPKVTRGSRGLTS
jgi:hypothetical protein